MKGMSICLKSCFSCCHEKKLRICGLLIWYLHSRCYYVYLMGITIKLLNEFPLYWTWVNIVSWRLSCQCEGNITKETCMHWAIGGTILHINVRSSVNIWLFAMQLCLSFLSKWRLLCPWKSLLLFQWAISTYLFTNSFLVVHLVGLVDWP